MELRYDKKTHCDELAGRRYDALVFRNVELVSCVTAGDDG